MNAAIARGEPPDRLLNNYVQVALLEHHPAIGKRLPNHVETLYNQFVITVDLSLQEAMENFVKKLPGMIKSAWMGQQ